MKMAIAGYTKKGRFIYTESQRQKGAYDILFVADGELKGEYICTVPSESAAEKHCEIYEQIHNQAVEEFTKEVKIKKILGEIAKEVRSDKEYKALIIGLHQLPPIEINRRTGLAKEIIRSKLKNRLPEIEAIKGRSLTGKEIEEYIDNFSEWD